MMSPLHKIGSGKRGIHEKGRKRARFGMTFSGVAGASAASTRMTARTSGSGCCSTSPKKATPGSSGDGSHDGDEEPRNVLRSDHPRSLRIEDGRSYRGTFVTRSPLPARRASADHGPSAWPRASTSAGSMAPLSSASAASPQPGVGSQRNRRSSVTMPSSSPRAPFALESPRRKECSSCSEQVVLISTGSSWTVAVTPPAAEREQTASPGSAPGKGLCSKLSVSRSEETAGHRHCGASTLQSSGSSSVGSGPQSSPE